MALPLRYYLKLESGTGCSVPVISVIMPFSLLGNKLTLKDTWSESLAWQSSSALNSFWVLLTYLSVLCCDLHFLNVLHNLPSIVCKNLKVKCVTSGTESLKKPLSVLLQIGFSSLDDVTPSGPASSSHYVLRHLHTHNLHSTAPACTMLFLPDFIHVEKVHLVKHCCKEQPKKVTSTTQRVSGWWACCNECKWSTTFG